MRRTVFTNTDGVVGEHVDHTQLAQCRQAHGATHVVGEDQEGAAVGADTTMQGHPVHHGSHGMLPDTEMNVPPAKGRIRSRVRIQRRGPNAFSIFDQGFVARLKICRTSYKRRNQVCHFLNDLSGKISGCIFLSGNRINQLIEQEEALGENSKKYIKIKSILGKPFK